MIFIHLGVMLLFVLLGVTFWRGKGAWLIAGYNTSSPKAKASYDEKALCRFMAKVMFAYVGCWGIIVLQSLLDSMVWFWVGFGAFLAVTVFAVVYMNTGNRFRR